MQDEGVQYNLSMIEWMAGFPRKWCPPEPEQPDKPFATLSPISHEVGVYL